MYFIHFGEKKSKCRKHKAKNNHKHDSVLNKFYNKVIFVKDDWLFSIPLSIYLFLHITHRMGRVTSHWQNRYANECLLKLLLLCLDRVGTIINRTNICSFYFACFKMRGIYSVSGKSYSLFYFRGKEHLKNFLCSFWL